MADMINADHKRCQKYLMCSPSIYELHKGVSLLRSLSVLASKTFDSQRNFKCVYLRKKRQIGKKALIVVTLFRLPVYLLIFKET